MILTLELPANKEEALTALARAQGVSAEQFVQRIVDQELERQEKTAANPAKRRISERIAEIMAHVPRGIRQTSQRRRTSGRSLRLRLAQERLVRAVFADTFYWIALLNPDDPDHDLVTAFDLSMEGPPLAGRYTRVVSPSTRFGAPILCGCPVIPLVTRGVNLTAPAGSRFFGLLNQNRRHRFQIDALVNRVALCVKLLNQRLEMKVPADYERRAWSLAIKLIHPELLSHII
jgi:hypothetical protein